ncbi:hypothetical protein S245_070191, partial [Arachis hypogaea]
KEKFLAELPKSLGDKVRDNICSLTPDGIIPYDALSYGQIISFIQKVALKICQDDKIQRQLAREKKQNRIDLETFCEQFSLPACHPRKTKRPSNQKILNLILKRISKDQGKVFKEPRMKKVSKRIFKSILRKTPLFAIHIKNQDMLANTL